MRKSSRLFLTVLALLAAAFWAGTADAGIPGSAHDTTVGAAGACSACHIPHGGGANRLWPATAGTGTYVGVVASLCSSCHSSTGGYLTNMANAFSDGFVYHASSHGSLMSVTNLPWRTDVANSGLPYAATATVFECTTCHDVHNDPAATTPAGNRPFLRDSLNEICARCHYQRHFVGGAVQQGATPVAGAWGSGFVGPTNPGSHPVGTDITGNVYGGGSVIAIAVQMRVLASAGAGGWSMGGHLTANTSGGVTCVSCHSVHGNQRDAQDNTAGQVTFTATAPNTNFLAIAQASAAFPWSAGRSVANGNGAFNALCEGCHGGGNNPATNPTGGAFSDALHNVNPGGAGTFSHPVDTYPSTYTAVTAFPANWPVGGGMTAGANVAPIPICESCHAPHPNAARTATTPRADVTLDSGPYILRDDVANFCSNCHTGTVAGHHPVGMSYNAGGVTYLRNTSGGGAQTLMCGTCHNGAGGAHNWTAAGLIALDNSWVPSNNGRSTAQGTDMYNAGMSKTCMDCHYAMDGHAASVSPTLGTSATAAVGLETAYQTLNQSMGTHYIGLMHTGSTTWRNAPLMTIQSTSATWSSVLGTSLAAPGWSRFGGDATNPVLVCESCHELEPGKNVGAGASQHLLLARYGEGNNGNDGTGDTATGRDVLCDACHGLPPGTHPLTGQNVGTGSTHVLSSTAASVRNPIPAAAYATMGTNTLSCDGCHQPHDANTASYTFILDAPATIAGAPYNGATMVGAGTLETTNPAATTAYPTATGAAGTYATPTLTGKGGSFTGFCDQCHVYAY